MDKSSRTQDSGISTAVVIFLLLAFVFALWLLWGLYGVTWFASRHADVSKMGQTGDLFGGINALFAAFAFAGVGAAAYFQYSTNVMQKQALTVSSFEPLFFHLLKLHSEAYRGLSLNFTELQKYANLEYPNKDGQEVATALRIIVGSGTFAQLAQLQPGQKQKREDFEQLLEIFDTFYLDNEDQLGPYYRAFYHVFNLIERSELSRATKVRYANIARSTLNKDELLLLMLNCSTKRGEDFKKLVETYGLLKHISTDMKNNYLDEALATTLFNKTARMSAEDRLSTSGDPSEPPAWWQRDIK